MKLFEITNIPTDDTATRFFQSDSWGKFVDFLVKTKDRNMRDLGTMLANDVKRGNYQQFFDTVNNVIRASQDKQKIPGMPQVSWEGGVWEHLLKAAQTLKQLRGIM